MAEHLRSLRIENYRALKRLELDDLGSVNLLVGRNGVGKTSILEAIRIWSNKTDLLHLYNILNSRGELKVPGPELVGTGDGSDNLLGVRYMFSGYPSLDSQIAPIVISPTQKDELTISIGPQPGEAGRLSGFEGDEELGLLVRYGHEPPSWISLDADIRRLRLSFHRQQQAINGEQIPLVMVHASGPERLSRSGKQLWEKVVYYDMEEILRDALRFIIPETRKVMYVESERQRRSIPIIHLEGQKRGIPLSSCGDGAMRLFEIILAAVNCKGGFLQVDELENGLHYSIQEKAWKLLFQLAQDLDIQVFATTHSSDCIQAFKEVASGNNFDSKGTLVRLMRQDDEVYSECLSGKKLQDRVELGREVR